jgi:glycopeptide antibiotics resistance protein
LKDQTPLIAVLVVFPLLALAATLPYLVRQYRLRGSLGVGHLALAGAFSAYLVVIAFFVILPVHPVTANFCDVHGVPAYVSPLRIVDRIHNEMGTFHERPWESDSLRQLVLNVALFIPMGVFLRVLFARSIAVSVALAVAASLLIELTQLTGDWFIYPCAYRYFDTADLLANTLGAFIGAFAAARVQERLSSSRRSGPRPS